MTSAAVSVVMPCLNEADSVGQCVRQALMHAQEVVVVDNGSTDGSAQIAAEAGARVLHVAARGYGNACRAGLVAAHHETLVMGDADLSYDFAEIPALVAPLEAGCGLVLGSRFQGKIAPRAMPFYSYYVGNPLLTGLLNRLTGLRLTDAQTGLRALRRETLVRMPLYAEGMEFALEMILQARRTEVPICEVPIRYLRRAGISKLRPLADGWRSLALLWKARQYINVFTNFSGEERKNL